MQSALIPVWAVADDQIGYQKEIQSLFLSYLDNANVDITMVDSTLLFYLPLVSLVHCLVEL